MNAGIFTDLDDCEIIVENVEISTLYNITITKF